MSGARDDDVARTVAEARETLGAALAAAQSDLQKVFIVFVVGLLGSIVVLRRFVWRRMKEDLNANPNIEIIAVTPFDVILLQVKIGLVVGVLLSLPLLVYYSRDALRARGWWPSQYVPRWKLAAGALVSLGLFVGGAAYGYVLFFPLAFDFLASNAVQAGFEPTYSIVKWAQFIFLLSLSFGLAAQLPLFMSGLAYARIVPYEIWRDYWKHAIVVLYALGALFTPPDPLTQVMWATPLVVLYGASLLVTKFVVTIRDAGERIAIRSLARERWNVIAGVALLAGVVSYAVGRALVSGRVDPHLRRLPFVDWTLEGATLFGLSPLRSVLLVAVLAGAGAALVTLVWLVFRALDELLEAEGRAVPSAPETSPDPPDTEGPHPPSAGSPTALDVGTLDEQGVRAAPVERFADMSESEALELASEAMDAGDPDRAQAVLDRYDEAQELTADKPAPGEGVGDEPAAEPGERVEDEPAAEPGERVGDEPPAEPGERVGDEPAAEPGERVGDEPPAEPGGPVERSGDVVRSTTAGMVDAFTEEETTEDDIGGYYYDLAFIFESLTSRAFRIVGLFMTVLAVVFFWLYRGFWVAVEGGSLPRVRLDLAPAGGFGASVHGFSLPSVRVYLLEQGGIGLLKQDFLSRLPEAVAPEQVQIVTLHPVEALIFEIKLSVVVAAVVTLPLVLYYAWPALKARGFAAGDRNVLARWTVALFGGLAVGSAFGYAYVAPSVISWLAADVAGANMVIAYRINSFGWLVFFTTVGVGLLAVVPVTMIMFHRGGLIPYRAMRDRWRVVTLGVFAIIAFLSPRGVFMMFILGIPVLLAYAVGLAVIWAYTLGGRREPRRRWEEAD